MSIKIQCDHCGIRRKVNDRLAGRRVRCPECEQPIRIPKLAEPVESQPVAEEPPAAEPSVALEPAEPVVAPEPVSVGPPPSDDEMIESVGKPVAETVEDDQPVIAADVRSEIQPAPVRSSIPHPSDFGQSAVDASVAAADAATLDDDDDGEVLVRSKRPEEEMDMTPMVDVTFLLLIFFMVTAAFSLQKSIEMPRQKTEAPSTQQQEQEEDQTEIVELEIDETGSFLVLAPQWERETPGKKNLIAALREAAAGAKDGMTLKVKVHEAAKIKSLVDAMDAGTIASYSPIEVTQVDQFQ